MKARFLVLILLSIPMLGLSQVTSDYLQLRKKHGINTAVGIEALEAFVGTRIMEIKGIVKGSFRTGGKTTLLLERTDGDNEFVEADFVPDFLDANDVPARLLVRATREDETAKLHAELIGAAPENVVAASEWSAKRAAEAARTPTKKPTKPTPPAKGRDWRLPDDQVVVIYGTYIQQRNRRLSTREAMNIAQGIIGFSLRYGVDPRLIMAMVMVESGFNPRATSRAGAMGLGQLMPGTARGIGVSNAYDSTQNLYGTVKVVRGHLEKYSRGVGSNYRTLVLTLAAYNAGSGAVARHGGVPPYRETQDYVRKVTNLYRQFTGGR
ncbi:MAG: lytic transglycosylase domain-containing protein [Fimbriimonas sp.]